MITIREDVECPIKCGACCCGCEIDAHTPEGCKLPRSERPKECLMYMCGEGTMAFNGEYISK